MPLRSPLRLLAVVAAYAVTVGVVGAVLVATADASATPWLALLAAMAIVHFGFGWLLARFWVAVLPVAVCIAAWLLDIGDFSILTLMVGGPCGLLVVSGSALRIGWRGRPGDRDRDDAGPPGDDAVEAIRAERRAARGGDTGGWDPVQPMFDDALA